MGGDKSAFQADVNERGTHSSHPQTPQSGTVAPRLLINLSSSSLPPNGLFDAEVAADEWARLIGGGVRPGMTMREPPTGGSKVAGLAGDEAFAIELMLFELEDAVLRRTGGGGGLFFFMGDGDGTGRAVRCSG